MAGLGAYSSFTGERGETLAWLQRVDSIGVNGVHAIAVASVLVRVQMLRIARTYDLLITRHCLASSTGNPRPRGSRVRSFSMAGEEAWRWSCGETMIAFRGAVSPVFYSRGGERVVLPDDFQEAAARITSAVCCLGCRHCHLLGPRLTTPDRNALDVANERRASVDAVAGGAA